MFRSLSAYVLSFTLQINILIEQMSDSAVFTTHWLNLKYLLMYMHVLDWDDEFFTRWKKVFFYFFIKCMQSMTMTLSRRCMYAKLHVIWSKSLLYIFSLINHTDSLRIQALSLKLSQSYSHFSSSLRTLRVLLFRF